MKEFFFDPEFQSRLLAEEDRVMAEMSATAEKAKGQVPELTDAQAVLIATVRQIAWLRLRVQELEEGSSPGGPQPKQPPARV